LLVFDVMNGVRTSVHPLCMSEFTMTCHFVYLPKEKDKPTLIISSSIMSR
jgi:hypothetical protein